ncbi:hypothetical protein PF005_g11633 [Phytophthora fragariae]|uniref:ARS-binding protein 1 N-terminal domain-containing protein n=1 Tax=Phytophthora fragariae TaxID=53985 RepID=A0A6A3YD10_9STRA|nr:hypothetical protein PF005_g11633 [Phytophthora fragariae]KAE9216628.1 hypothetical protein PF002_g17016 [Phytophthora fragariae]KAE9230041.1 hypothetical protein PF004_g10601 [Phytophthora fragariae]
MTQHELAAWVKSTLMLKRAPAQTTICDILKRVSTIMSTNYGDKNRRKPLHVTSPITTEARMRCVTVNDLVKLVQLILL